MANLLIYQNFALIVLSALTKRSTSLPAGRVPNGGFPSARGRLPFEGSPDADFWPTTGFQQPPFTGFPGSFPTSLPSGFLSKPFTEFPDISPITFPGGFPSILTSAPTGSPSIILDGPSTNSIPTAFPNTTQSSLQTIALSTTPTAVANATPTTFVETTPTTVVSASSTASVETTLTTAANATATTLVETTPNTVANATPTTLVETTPATTANATPTTFVEGTPTQMVNVTPTTLVETAPTTLVNVTITPLVETTATTVANTTPITSVEAMSTSMASTILQNPLSTTNLLIPTDSAASTGTAIITPSSAGSSPVPSGSNNGQLRLSLVNNLASDNVHAYITGLDSSNRVVLVATDGTFFYPNATSSSAPEHITANVAIALAGQSQTTQITIPDFISSARVWFADGELQFFVVNTPNGIGLVEPTVVNPADPSIHVNWGFVELTYTADGGLFANLSFVDFVGLPLGMKLLQSSGATQQHLGLPANGASQVCDGLKSQAASDGFPWDQLCVTSSDASLLRVLSPSSAMASQSSLFSTYWENYVDQVWQRYSTWALTINTQTSAGYVNCSVSGNTLSCAGDNRSYAKPSTADIFGCNTGPFSVLATDNNIHSAVVPRLCAAFNRATFLLSGGNVQPSLPASSYYPSPTFNYYSEIVHANEVDGKGYAFPYDDVSPNDQENTAGVVAAPDPELLTIFVGGS